MFRPKVDDKEHGTTIKLFMPHPNHMDKKGSVFIYDENIKVWFLKESYDNVNVEEDDISRVPFLSDSMIDHIGMWKKI